MEYEDGRKRTLKFGAEFALTPDLTVAAKLINKEGDPIGIELVLTKDFLESHAQAFVRLKKTLQENAIEAGITIPW